MVKARAWFAFMVYGFGESTVQLSTAVAEQHNLLTAIYLAGSVCCAGAAIDMWEGLERRRATS